MEKESPVIGTVVIAAAIALVVWATVGPVPAHKRAGDHQSIARR